MLDLLKVHPWVALLLIGNKANRPLPFFSNNVMFILLSIYNLIDKSLDTVPWFAYGPKAFDKRISLVMDTWKNMSAI